MRFRVLFSILLCGLFAGCGGNTAHRVDPTALPTQPAAAVPQPTATVADPQPTTQLPQTFDPADDANVTHMLLLVRGRITLKRPSWQGFFPIRSGTTLRLGDLLELDAASRAYVLCNNLTVVPVTPGVITGVRGCDRTPAPDLQLPDGSIIGPARAGVPDPRVPYIISPRHTRLLTDRPTLQWHAVPGITDYRVHIEGTDWKMTTSGPPVPPDQVPSLSAGNSYLLVVEAVGGKSSIDEGVESLSFTVLDPTERERVQSLVQRLRSELVIVNADSTFVDFAQASFFFDLQLYAEARSLLENIHTRSDGTTATYMLLARVQYETGLTIAAATSYTHAYSLAVVTDELEVQAYAAWQLGMIYRNLRQNEETQRWLDLAAEHYEKLGDSTMVQQIHNTEHTSP